MLELINAFVKRSRVTILLLIIISVLGWQSYLRIPKESTPDVKIPIIYSVAVLEGISPQDAERLLLRPMENKLKTIDGIKEMTGYANEGSAVILVEFHAGFNSNKALEDVRNKMSEAEALMPLDVKKPVVHEVNLSFFPVLNVMLTGDVPVRALLKIARELSNKIEGTPGVLQVSMAGNRLDSLEIIVTPEVLEGYGLSPAHFQQVISNNNRLIAAGSMTNKSGNFAIKIPSLIDDYQMLMDFPIKVNGTAVLKLGDIAEVRRTFKEPETVAYVNGKPAVVLEVSKRTGENIIQTVSNVKQIVQQEQVRWPQNLEIVYAGDQSKEIIDMVTDLENNIIIASLLVIVVVVMFVGFRSAMLISLSIPFSFLAAILLLELGGYTLNVVVLFSLILTIGMIVDDAIVVSEYADRLMHKGVPASKAFLIAAKRMIWPIITSTLVKIIVFMPLLFWPGVVGQFMKYMPITAIAILTNSLIFALFFQPTLGPIFGAPARIRSQFKDAVAEDSEELEMDDVDFSKLDALTSAYHRILLKVLSKPKIFVTSIAGMLVGVYAFFIIFGTGVEFFPKVEPESINLSVITPGNFSLNEREKIMQEVQERVATLKSDIRVIYMKAGDFQSNMQMPENTIGSIFIEYQNWQERRKSKTIIKDIREKLSDLKGLEFQVLENSSGPPPEKPIKLDIASLSHEEADKFADGILEFMRQSGAFSQVEDSRSKGSIEWRLDVDRAEAAKYGIDINAVGSTIRMLSNGLKISSFRPDDVDEEVDVLVRFPENYRNLIELDRVKVMNTDGNAIPISYVARKSPHPKTSKIKRVNRERVITIKADVRDGQLVDTNVSMLKNWVQKAQADNNVIVRFKGEDQDQQETGGFLKNAFLLTLIMMFVIMLTQFNNYYHTIVVMSAVFLSTVGVLLGLIATWQPFGIVMCGVGIIALGGIVLNNNILFIDTYQHLRMHGVPIEQSIIRAGVQRLRPIMLTAITAILGLLPMVFGVTINLLEYDITYDAPSSQWWRQLAASIAGGLSFATILTLFFTPCLLMIGKRFDHHQ
jgi:multidrug efflux pump